MPSRLLQPLPSPRQLPRQHFARFNKTPVPVSVLMLSGPELSALSTKIHFLGTGYSSIIAFHGQRLSSLARGDRSSWFPCLCLHHSWSLPQATQKSKKPLGQDKLLTISALGILVVFSTSAMFLDVFESSKIAILFWSFMGLALSTNKKI